MQFLNECPYHLKHENDKLWGGVLVYGTTKKHILDLEFSVLANYSKNCA